MPHAQAVVPLLVAQNQSTAALPAALAASFTAQQAAQAAAPPPAAPAPAQDASAQPWAPAPGQKSFGRERKVVMLHMKKLLLLSLSLSLSTLLSRPCFLSCAGEAQYGKYDRVVCSLDRLEDIKSWLLDEDACPTVWAPLLAIRRAFEGA
jgi:hypothetical protein